MTDVDDEPPPHVIRKLQQQAAARVFSRPVHVSWEGQVTRDGQPAGDRGQHDVTIPPVPAAADALREGDFATAGAEFNKALVTYLGEPDLTITNFDKLVINGRDNHMRP